MTYWIIKSCDRYFGGWTGDACEYYRTHWVDSQMFAVRFQSEDRAWSHLAALNSKSEYCRSQARLIKIVRGKHA